MDAFGIETSFAKQLEHVLEVVQMTQIVRGGSLAAVQQQCVYRLRCGAEGRCAQTHVQDREQEM